MKLYMWYGRSRQWPFMIGYHSNWQSMAIRQETEANIPSK